MPRRTLSWRGRKPPPGSKVDWADPINRGLTNLYLLNVSPNQGIDIASRQDLTSTAGTPEQVASRFGKGVRFVRASTESLNSGELGELSNLTAVTMVAWVKPASFSSFNGILFRGKVGTTRFKVAFTGAGKLLVTTGPVTYNGAGAITCSTNKWYQIVITYSNARGLVGYINNVVDYTAAGAGDITFATDDRTYIGQDASFAGRYFDGIIDHVRIYDRALTPNEVAQLYAHPFKGITTGAVKSIRPAAGGGGATTHATTGALAGAGATIAGSAARERVHPTSGVLAGSGGVITGAAARTRVHPTSGVLAGDGGVLSGAAARARVHPASGALAGDGGSISGAADHVAPGGTHDTSGALAGAGGAVAGTAAHIAVAGTAAHIAVHGTSGALEGAGGSISGAAAHIAVHGTSGALAGSGGAVAGDAARVAAAVSHDTSGALSGGGGAVSGDARGPDADGGGMGFSMSRMRRLVKIKFNGKLYQALEDQIPELLETLEEQAHQKVTKKRNAKSKPAPVATVVSAPADVLPSLSARIADVNRAIGDLWRVDEDEDEEILWLML